jgi:ParB-like chromosome segregation protein Spo0J
MARTAVKLGRTDLFRADPLTQCAIVTKSARADAGPIDVIDPAHPLCEKHERPVTESFIANIEKFGLLQPIRAIKDGDSQVIVAIGRRRVRACRIINARREKANKSLPESEHAPMIEMPVLLMRGDDVTLFGSKLSENMQRADYDPLAVADSLADYIRMGGSVELAATVAGKPKQWVDAHLALGDCSPDVRKLVAAGTASVTAAASVASLPRAQQAPALEAARAATPTTGKADARTVTRQVRANRTGKAQVLKPSQKMQRKALNRFLTTKGSDNAIAGKVLSWVLDGTQCPELGLTSATVSPTK